MCESYPPGLVVPPQDDRNAQCGRDGVALVTTARPVQRQGNRSLAILPHLEVLELEGVIDERARRVAVEPVTLGKREAERPDARELRREHRVQQTGVAVAFSGGPFGQGGLDLGVHDAPCDSVWQLFDI